MRRRNPSAGLVVFWVKLRQKGYSRSITGLYRILRKSSAMAVKPKNPKYIPKPYEKMSFPGHGICVSIQCNEYFYATHSFYSFEDFAKQLKVHNRKYNKFPMRPLNWRSPQEIISAFVQDGELVLNM